MLVTSVQAQSAISGTIFDHQSPILAQGIGGIDSLVSILPFILIFVIMYFLILRPQRKQMKERQAMLANIKRNDTIVTGGGIVGKVTKVIDDNQLEVEIAKDTKIKAMRSLVADVWVKGEPISAARKASVKTPTIKKK
jgi:preprotein translocase subunit YajC